MSQSPIEEFVEAALDLLPTPHTVEVTHDLFALVEQNPALLHDYHALREQYRSPRQPGVATVNRTIGSWVRKKLGRSTLSSGHPSTRSRLVKTWSRLG